ncbi:dehydrogenase [Desulfitobacterium hafniense]|nr:dehydrogenase [Desulfitobacterium hafniense]
MRPDVNHAEFILYIGAFPGHSGKPMSTIARQVAQQTGEGTLKIVVVDPVMCGGAISPVGKNTKWIPIKPTTDSAFIMGMLHWIIENQRYNEDYLSSPHLAAAKSKGFASWCNASHLVIVDESHPNNRKLLRAEDLGLAVPPSTDPTKTVDYFMVIDPETNQPAIYNQVSRADLVFDGEVQAKSGGSIRVKTAFAILKESVFSQGIAEYSQICKVPEETIMDIAREFTAHGTKVAVDGTGNTASANGYDIANAMHVLATMVGCHNLKGGMLERRVAYKSLVKGPRYDLGTVANAPNIKGKGILLSRTGVPYEKTPEYKQKVAKGENPYPSKLPWHPIGSASDNQAFFSVINSYPYQTKILMLWMANPLMSVPAAGRQEIIDELKKVARVPLIIAMDAFMAETTALADYIIPDTTPYESWGLANNEGNTSEKVTTLRWPVVEPLTAKLSDNRHACYENYIIDVAKAIGLPGFGEKAIKDTDGNTYALNTPEDYFLRGVANVAFDGQPVPDLTDEEMQIQDLESCMQNWKDCLKPEEYRKAVFILSRGGRFEEFGQGYAGDRTKYPQEGCFNLYGEKMALAKNSFTGQYFRSGTLVYNPETLADGTSLDQLFPEAEWPFKAAAYKPKFRSVSMLENSILRELNQTNKVEINPEDAAQLGLVSGDKVRLVSATGGEAEGILQVRQGIARGSVGIAYGYGHWEYGVKKHTLGEKELSALPGAGQGVFHSGISLIDPKVKNGIFGFSEMSTGGTSRNGGAFKILKV